MSQGMFKRMNDVQVKGRTNQPFVSIESEANNESHIKKLEQRQKNREWI